MRKRRPRAEYGEALGEWHEVPQGFPTEAYAIELAASQAEP
jgi:hypothetical protein